LLESFAYSFIVRRYMVAQIATGEKCDLVSGSYIRGAFELALAENSTNSSARVLEVGRCRLTL
jgi:hypothetical protein